MNQLEQYYFDIDLVKNRILNARMHPLSTVDRTTLGSTLTVNDAGLIVYDLDIQNLYLWTGAAWKTDTALSDIQTLLDSKVDKVTGKQLSTNDFTDAYKAALDTLNTTISNAIANKVDKVAGMGLSSNDYTTAEKNKLAGIQDGAKINVQPDWNEVDTTKDDFIKNKPSIPAKTSDLTNDSGYITLADLPASGGLEQYSSISNFPATGITTKIYLDTSTREAYFWTGSVYKIIGSFTSDFTVSLSGGKNYLKWTSGSQVPATDKSARMLLLEGAVEAIAPTVSLTSPTTIKFNQTNISNVLNFSFTINSLGASVSTAVLQWRRNNTGAWTTLSTSTALTTFTHTLTDTNFNTQPFNYQYIVTDSAGGTNTATINITPGAYAAPTISISQTAGALNGPQTNASREIGNVSTNITGTITQNSPNVALISYQLQYSVNGGTWTNLNAAVSVSGSSVTISSINHNDSSLKSSTSIAYRFQVTDAYTTSTSGTTSISFQYLYLYGYNTTNGVLSDTQTYALGNGILLSSRTRTLTGVTAGTGLYTFIAYLASFGNITGIIQDGATPVLGAFTEVGMSITVTNQYGVTGSYNLYKSNATNAFTNNTLAIS
jgi:hypothetical protein